MKIKWEAIRIYVFICIGFSLPFILAILSQVISYDHATGLIKIWLNVYPDSYIPCKAFDLVFLGTVYVMSLVYIIKTSITFFKRIENKHQEQYNYLWMLLGQIIGLILYFIIKDLIHSIIISTGRVC